MMFSGRRSWWTISLRWKACSPLAICSRMRAPCPGRAGGVEHPLRQRLALDVFDDHIKVLSLSGLRQGLRTCALSRRRATHSSSMKRSRAAGSARRSAEGDLSTTRSPVSPVDGEIDVAAGAGVQVAHDGVAVELRGAAAGAGTQVGLAETALAAGSGQGVDPRQSVPSGCRRCHAPGPARARARAAASRSAAARSAAMTARRRCVRRRRRWPAAVESPTASSAAGSRSRRAGPCPGRGRGSSVYDETDTR